MKIIKNTFYLLIPLIMLSCIERDNSTISNPKSNDSIFIKDFNQYWKTLDENFGYFDIRKTNWEKVKTIYSPLIDTVSTRNSFIGILEKCNNELYNGHLGLNTNTPNSSKLIPTSTDLWAVHHDNKYFIASIRENSVIENGELRIGMEILKYNGINIDNAVKEFLPQSFTEYDSEVYEYAVNTLLAGRHNTKRKITVSHNEKPYEIELPYSKSENYYSNNKLLSSKTIENNIGYIKINNTLGKNDLIKQFDETLDSLMETKALIIDLRETPSGGNNTIAKAIMGRFISNEKPYQRYRYVNDEKETGVEQIWTELVIPRKTIYKKPLVVLVGRWTGSMGEGITIGFNQMERAEIVGTEMAKLLGGTWSYTLNNTGIGFQFPGIKIYHIDKTPRENFIPEHRVSLNSEYIEKAIEIINKANTINTY